jgi:hypothetical protein
LALELPSAFFQDVARELVGRVLLGVLTMRRKNYAVE